MSNDTILWVVGQALLLIAAGITAYFNLFNRVSENYTKLSERLIRLETTMDVIGQNAAKLLHSPHDPWGMDAILDKYIDRNYELSWDEWEEVLKQCNQVMADKSVDKFYRFLAGQLAAVCHHKLLHLPDASMKSKSIIAEESKAQKTP